MCKDNRGLSLVELIVVMAIMAVMVGGSVLSISMLTGARARQAAKNMEAQLNDIKTGAMSRAGEYMVVRYIEVTNANKAAYAKEGIEKSGYYAEKHINTVDNKSGSLLVDVSTQKDPGDTSDSKEAEYNYLASGNVIIGVNDTAEYMKEAGTTSAILIEYNRSNGTLKRVELGSMSGTGDANDVDSFAKSSTVELTKLTFKSGLRTYTIEFEPATGKHTLK